MARRELVDGFGTRLVAGGVAAAAVVAVALSLAGGAHSATASAARAATTVGCATMSDSSGRAFVEIRSCPDFFSAVGAVPVVDFLATPGLPVTYNLDYLQLEGSDWWKSASHNLQLNGLAPGYHTIRYRVPSASGDVIAEWTWIMPGAAPENVVVTSFGPSNSKATITWTTQIPAWRTYCSVNGSVEKICRLPAGLSLNGLPDGWNAITIRATNGPDDPGRVATVGFERSDPTGTLSIGTDGPWVHITST